MDESNNDSDRLGRVSRQGVIDAVASLTSKGREITQITVSDAMGLPADRRMAVGRTMSRLRKEGVIPPQVAMAYRQDGDEPRSRGDESPVLAETRAIDACARALDILDVDARCRVLGYLLDLFGEAESRKKCRRKDTPATPRIDPTSPIQSPDDIIDIKNASDAYMWNAVLARDGDRREAARRLNVSARTIYARFPVRDNNKEKP